MPSASGLERTALCAGSDALVHIRSTNKKQVAGNEKHDRMAADPAAWAKVLDDLGLAPEEASEYLRETAFAWDVDKRRVRLLPGPRQYDDLTDREIGGTADLIVSNDAGLLVADLKTGRPEFVTPAKDNLQLRFYALCAARCHDLDAVKVALVFVPEDGDPWADVATVDSLDMADFEIELRRILDRVTLARRAVAENRLPSLTEGAHCTYCPAFSLCPAKTSLARALGGAPQTIADMLSALAPDQAGEAWVRLRLAKEVLREVEDTLTGMARQDGGIPLPNGKVVREVETSRREIDGGKADLILGGAFGPEVARAVVKKSVTQEAMKRAMTRPEFLAAMQLLDDCGAIKLKTTRTVREVEARALPSHATATEGNE